MNQNLWNLLSKFVENIGTAPTQTTDKPSKLFENENVKKFLPTETKGIEVLLKMLDEISETFTNETLANKRDAQLHKFNKDLLVKVYCFGDQLSSVDLVYYVLLHNWMSGLNDKERFVFCNISRWFNFIQNQKSIQSILPIIAINQTPPPPEPKKEKPVVPATNTTAAAATTTTTDQKKEQQPPKEKQQRKPVVKEEPKPIDISRFDMRVGQIVSCKKHENADSLYIESIDLGEEKPRTIVSGLVKFYPLEQMINRRVFVLCNLKPSNLKSVKSEGMVLCAGNDEHTIVEFIEPPQEAKIGERVYFENFKGEPDAVLKKEVLDAVLPDLKTNANKIATYKGDEWRTSAGPCTSKTLANVLIR